MGSISFRKHEMDIANMGRISFGNLKCFQSSETLKPRNQEMLETKRPRNHATLKPRNQEHKNLVRSTPQHTGVPTPNMIQFQHVVLSIVTGFGSNLQASMTTTRSMPSKISLPRIVKGFSSSLQPSSETLF